jgi:hypothetical protein
MTGGIGGQSCLAASNGRGKMAQTQQGARKQNWLLTGVTVGSIILAILGWTRKVDCACPKDFNATVSSSVKGLGEGLGVPVGARVVDAKGMAIRVGAPPQGAAAPLGRPAAQGVGTGSAAGSTNLTNTRGPLGVGRGIGTTGGVAGGGNFRADGTPFNGGGDGFARNNGGNGIGGTGRGVGAQATLRADRADLACKILPTANRPARPVLPPAGVRAPARPLAEASWSAPAPPAA